MGSELSLRMGSEISLRMGSELSLCMGPKFTQGVRIEHFASSELQNVSILLIKIFK